MHKTTTILLPLIAAGTLAAGCLRNGKAVAVPDASETAQEAPLFPVPFGNVNLGMTERDFRAILPEASKDETTKYAAPWTYWKVMGAGGFEDVSFGFLPTNGTTTLTYAMLSYKTGIPFREVLAEAEKRLGAAPVRTTLFNGALCFQRTWRLGRNETTLLFWPPAECGTSAQWRISDISGGSSAHDGFLPELPQEIGKGAWAGFRTIGNESGAFDPSVDLSVEKTRRLFDSLAGWETFTPVDLESLALADEGVGECLCGHWIIEIEPKLPCFTIGADATWVANLGLTASRWLFQKQDVQPSSTFLPHRTRHRKHADEVGLSIWIN